MSKGAESGKEVECGNPLVVVRRPVSKSKQSKAKRSDVVALSSNGPPSGAGAGVVPGGGRRDSGQLRLEPERGPSCVRRNTRRRYGSRQREAGVDLPPESGDA